MRRGRTLMLLAIVVIFVIIAIVALPSLLGGDGEDDKPAAVQTEEALNFELTVVILLEPLEIGDRITGEKIDTLKVTRNDEYFIENPQFALEDTLNSGIDSLFGDEREIILFGGYATSNVDAGEFLSRDDVTFDAGQIIGGQSSSHAGLIPAGSVAFPIPTNRFSNVAFGVSRGDHVNVIATLLFVDLDSQFQSILPNLTAGVIGWETGDSVVLYNGTSTELRGDPLADTLVAQSASGGPTSPQGRAELDSLLNQPFYYIPSELQRPRIVSQTVLFNKQVLQLGNFQLVDEQGRELVILTPKPTLTGPQQSGEEPIPTDVPPWAIAPDVVTLIVEPQEAVTLNFLVYSKVQLTLALRPPGDTTDINFTEPVTLQFLMERYQIPSPVKLPYGLNPRIDVLSPPLLPTPTIQTFP